MASGQTADELKLTPSELRRLGGDKELPGAPIVHVERVEEVKPESGCTLSEQGSDKQNQSYETSPVSHETPSVKTTVNEEHTQKTSIMDKVKGKVQQVGGKLRPNSAVHANEEDPHPSIA
ncbi:hypothetical protein R1sor_023276 [Riccia sorocarpa]|uniref:Uncharacterized protein n=1 Tax=Riccia sorocarpa TaxID=122646 RepID=A0ABD3GQI0_9MARC